MVCTQDKHCHESGLRWPINRHLVAGGWNGGWRKGGVGLLPACASVRPSPAGGASPDVQRAPQQHEPLWPGAGSPGGCQAELMTAAPSPGPMGPGQNLHSNCEGREALPPFPTGPVVVSSHPELSHQHVGELVSRKLEQKSGKILKSW